MKNATRVLVSTLGTIMGVAGIEHGVGEVLQGNVTPSGVMILSWPDAAFFRAVEGEPAMTIVPNLLVTGILAILFSSVFLVWVTIFIQRKNGGLILALISIPMLLFGGGIFPPILGIILGILGIWIHAPLTWWRAHLSSRLVEYLSKMWIWLFAANLIAWLLLFPGLSIIGYFSGASNPTVTIAIILFAFVSLLVTIISGFAYNIRRQTA